jgi:predicted GNAT family N-acyltransferase
VLVRAAEDAQEVTEALALRERVFCGEQGVDFGAERDGRDPEALHVVAFGEGALVGTCRVLLDGDVARLGRMAVEPGLRGHGIGAAVLDEAERQARAAGARSMRLHAQAAAESLYARAGYEPRGERFVEEGIEHVAMEKRLA